MPHDDWRQIFFSELRRSPNVSRAARAANVDRIHVYRVRAADPEFAAAWDDALAESTDGLIGEAYRRACEGTEKPVFHQGEQCGVIREYSDTLAIFLLKTHRPEVYGDRSKVELSGPDGGPLTVSFEQAVEQIYADGEGDPDPGD